MQSVRRQLFKTAPASSVVRTCGHKRLRLANNGRNVKPGGTRTWKMQFKDIGVQIMASRKNRVSFAFAEARKSAAYVLNDLFVWYGGLLLALYNYSGLEVPWLSTVKRLKTGKVACCDKIRPEMLKALHQCSATIGPRPSAGPWGICYQSVQNKTQIAPKTAFFLTNSPCLPLWGKSHSWHTASLHGFKTVCTVRLVQKHKFVFQ